MGERTGNKHQDADGDDENIHRLEALQAGEDAAVGPHVHDEADVEEEAERADGGRDQPQVGLAHPVGDLADVGVQNRPCLDHRHEKEKLRNRCYNHNFPFKKSQGTRPFDSKQFKDYNLLPKV